MTVKIASSEQKNVQTAVAELKAGLQGSEGKAILYFASAAYAGSEISAAMQAAFPGVVTFGCTTAGELISGAMKKESVVAMALPAELVTDLQVAIVPQISKANHVEAAFEAFAAHFNEDALAMSPEEYVGLVLCDGLSMAEEKIIDAIGNLTNVTFIGGSAGDDLQFKQTQVFAQGKAYSDAAVLVLLKMHGKFSFIKTQSFCVSETKLTATKVDEAKRIVLEFDDKPAVEAYAAAVKVQPEAISEQFMKHPLGLVIDAEPYVRSPQQAKDGAIAFYCNVKKGMEMAVLESTDIIADTKAALAAKAAEEGPIRAIINFNCILRTLDLEKQGRTAEYGALFATVPTVGFSTYGEAYIGHINQTATMLLFF